MKRSLEQRYAIKFCVRLGKNATETYQMPHESFKEGCISSSQCGSVAQSLLPNLKKAHEQVSMLIVFFDVHFESAPQGQTLSAAFYLEVHKRLKRRVSRIRPDIKNVFKLHHDNASRHTLFVVINFLTQNKTFQPPYSPDLAPFDFFCSPNWKKSWRSNTRSRWRIFKLKLQGSWEAFQWRNFRVLFWPGRIVSSGVSMQRTILKNANRLYQSDEKIYASR